MFKSVDIIIAELLGTRHTTGDAAAVQRLRDMHGYDGDIAQSEGRFANAIPSYQRHLEINPHDFQRNLSLSTSYFQLYCLPEAEAACDTAIELKPQDANARIQRSIIRFARGNWQGALSDMEYRHDAGWAREVNWSTSPRELKGSIPFTGSAADKDQPLLVMAEGGAGDTVQFAALLLALKAHTSQIIFEVQNHLLGLMQGLARHGITVVARKDTLPFTTTRHISLLSLLHILQINPLEPNPYSAAYELPVDEEKLTVRRAELMRDYGEGYKIGIAWRSDPNNKFDLGRDVPIELMRPFTELDGVTAICLLDDASEDERRALPNLKYRNKIGERISFEDMAITMKCLDLVISIDTVWPNLAGALRVPALLLLKHIPNWRWGLAGTSTPLAPTTTLLRQPEAGNWQTPVHKAYEQLLHLKQR